MSSIEFALGGDDTLDLERARAALTDIYIAERSSDLVYTVVMDSP